MRLAETITITLGADSIELRPSLRCAMRLERRPGSFAKLTRDVMDQSLSAAVEIITDHTDMPDLAKRILETGLPRLTTPLLHYVMGIAGIDPEDAPANDHGRPTKQRRDVPFNEHLAGLYRIGTGWLGWTPKDTLDATPAEIMEAYKGRLEMLKGIFGSGENETPDRSTLSLDEKVKTALGSFSTTKVKRTKVA